MKYYQKNYKVDVSFGVDDITIVWFFSYQRLGSVQFGKDLGQTKNSFIQTQLNQPFLNTKQTCS